MTTSDDLSTYLADRLEGATIAWIALRCAGIIHWVKPARAIDVWNQLYFQHSVD